MNSLSGVSDFFGLDIGSDSIRLVQLRGSTLNKQLIKYAYVPVDKKITRSDSRVDQQKLMQILADLVSKARLSTRNVALGLPSSKVFTTVADIEKLPSEQINKAIHYQIDAMIPTPINETKLDWVLLGDSPADPNKSEVIVTSVVNSYVENLLDQIESIGLNVISFEPDYFALCRSLIKRGENNNEGILILDIGNYGSDIAIVLNDMPRLMRNVSIGNETLIRAVAQSLSIDENQASQLIYKFGLSQDKGNNQVYQPLVSSIDSLVSEIEKSMRFFLKRYNGIKISKIIVSGWASVLPAFPLALSRKFGINIEIGNSWVNVNYDQSKQNELLAISNHFSVAVGLAERLHA